MTKLYRKIEIVSDMNNNLRLESNIVKWVSENMRVKGVCTHFPTKHDCFGSWFRIRATLT